MELYNWILYFFVYGVLGWCTEVAYAACKHGKFVNRGFLNGPICPVYGIGVGVVVQFLMPLRHQELLLYVASTVLVTIIEGLTGFLLDKIFHHRWWDYSSLRFNLGGYVCLRFSLIWGTVCVFIVKVFHPVVLDLLDLIPFYAGLVLIVIFGIALLADLYVTASEILKFNKRLQSMERIAEELRNLSDKMGENIYEGVVSSAEAREEGRKRMEEGKSQLTSYIESAQESVQEKIESAQEYIGSAQESIGERVGSVQESIGERVGSVQESIGERVGSVQESIGERVGSVQESIGERVGSVQESIGERIGNVQESIGERIESAQESGQQQLARYRELQKKYAELAGKKSKVSRRLLRAFPNMTAPGFEQAMEKIREAMESRR